MVCLPLLRVDLFTKYVFADQQELRRISQLESSLLEKLARPQNAGVVATMAKMDDFVAMQGNHPVAEINQADKDGSGGVSGVENWCIED